MERIGVRVSNGKKRSPRIVGSILALMIFLAFVSVASAELLSSPVLISPSNGATGVSTTPYFDWSSVSGATHYWLMVAENKNDLPTNPNAESCPNCEIHKPSLTQSYYQTLASEELEEGITYYWQVQPYEWGGSSVTRQGEFSSQYGFTTESSATVPSPPTPTSPGSSSSPGPTISTLTPTFQWSSVSGADYYGLYIRDLATNTLVFDSQALSLQITGTSYALSSGVLEWGKPYRWNMNSHNSVGWGSYSGVLYFTTEDAPNQLPTASLSADPRSGNAPLTVTFSMSASDPGGSISAWVLDVDGDGNTDYSGNGNPPSTQQHTYTSPSSASGYSIALMVSDNNGATAFDTETVIVGENNPPTASLSANPRSGKAPLAVTFTMSASDSDGSISTWVLNVGDGSPVYSGNGNPPSTQPHTYTTSGTYTVILMVSDNEDATASGSETISVGSPNQLPTASLSANPRSGNAPLAVTFTMSASDPDGIISAWVLDVDGDGNTDYSGNGNPPSTQPHTYTTSGTYTAILMVSDDDGATDPDIETISVGSPNQLPTASLSANPRSGNAPLAVTFTMSASDPDGSISAWVLDAGDGSPSYSGNGNPPLTQPHTYTTSGTYTAILMVSDNEDATAPATETISVSPPSSLPDLVVEDIQVDPDPPTAGGLTTVGIRIKNQGDSDATETFFLEFYFDDTYKGHVYVDGLTAGSTHTSYWSAQTWPSDTNLYTLRGVVDPDNSISESNEGNNELSREFSATLPEATVPSPPSNLRVTDVGDGYVKIAWDPPSSDGGSPVTNYKIYRGTSSNGETYLTTIGNFLAYTDDTVANGQTYYYKVSAVNSAGEGTKSGEAVATPTQPTVNNPPDLPTSLFQLKSDSVTEIREGGTTDERTVIFKGDISDPDGDSVKLQIELRRLGEYGGNFDETKGGFKESELVESGSVAVAYASELIDDHYHWRARAVDEKGKVSEWVEFGTPGNIDFTVFVDSDGDGLSDEEELNLALKYEPILALEKGEYFYPTKVENFLNNSRLMGQTERITGPPTTPEDLGEISNTRDYRLDLAFGPDSDADGLTDALKLWRDRMSDTDKGIIYSSVSRVSADLPIYCNPLISLAVCPSPPLNETREYIAVQYWFLYIYNNHLVFPNHEGDWEHITVYLDPSTKSPAYVTYNEHNSSKAIRWGEVKKTGNHSTVYVANGSHASYPKPGKTFRYLDLDILDKGLYSGFCSFTALSAKPLMSTSAAS